MNDRAQSTLVALCALLSLGLVSTQLRDTWFGGQTLVGQPAPRATPRFCVDLERAGVEELSLLPSIGPELARRIVAARQSGHQFRSADDLLAIRGIGPKKLAGLRHLVYVADRLGTNPEPGKR